ncbi:MAG: sigma-54-dependent transcriptional regulator [Gammaproteobacteria bacterium]
MAKVLVIHRQPEVRHRVRALLETGGYVIDELAEVPDDGSLLQAFQVSRYRCVIAEASPGPDGEPVNGPLLAAASARAPIILVAEGPDIRQAIAAVKSGASDYLPWPCSGVELIAAVERGIAEHIERVAAEPAELNDPIIGDSPTMRRLFESIKRIGPTHSPVLIRGESGTGKALIARALHAASRRAHGPMVALNCASLPANVIETELFGYGGARGRIQGPLATPTPARPGLFEAAHHGTLFLEEIDKLAPEIQARLLHVLQDGTLRRFGEAVSFPIDVRLIASTQRDLARMVAAGMFREDLYYRLNVVDIEVPPLRERGEDILFVADFILERVAARLGRQPKPFDGDARQAMLRYHWPGNVQELENSIERALILCEQPRISAELLALERARPTPRDAASPQADSTSLEDYFVSFVLANQDQLSETALALKLGISRKSLWERRQRLNIPRRRGGGPKPAGQALGGRRDIN